MTILTNVLITGANAGLGKECALQLSQLACVEKIYLGCRSRKKAEAAKKELEGQSGFTSKFDILIIDVCDLKSVEKAVESLPVIDGLVLNAGGPGIDPLGESSVLGVCNILALNLLGHVYLTNLLLDS
ncbi:MAG: hypothetical protein SGARI_003296, partial [Bacillariaceae sp.]